MRKKHVISHVFRYFWISNFFFQDSASVHKHPVNPAYESATFGIRSPEWKFFNTLWIRNGVDAKSGYIVNVFIQWRHKIELSSLRPWIFRRCRAYLNFGFRSYNLCAVKPSYYYCTPQLRQTAAWHFEAFSMSDGWIGRFKQVKRTNWCLVGQLIVLVKQLLKKTGDKIFARAEDRFIN